VRVAWVLYGDLAARTGGTIYDAKVVEGLRQAGDDVRVVSLDERGPPRSTRGFRPVVPLIAPSAPTVTRALALVRELRALAPDVVVGDELCFRELAVTFRLLGAGWQRRAPRRFLLVHHLTAWEPELAPLRRRALGLVEALAIGTSDRVIATSQTTRDRLIAEGTRRPIDVVLPGADRLAPPRPRTPARDGTVRFLFVGSVVARKRVIELVRAFARGASVNGRLVIVGSTTRDPVYAREVKRAIAQHHQVERVTMVGELGEEGVARALADADVLVMPSSLEGYGIAATEAIHAGIPVIAARAQGLLEALAPCPEARRFADDQPSLTAALASFATEAPLRVAMTAAAEAARQRMPTWASCAAEVRAALLR
jgi:glycosyltransferase involved in cell wall biosynthesis